MSGELLEMKCDRCGRPIVGGTGITIGRRNVHNWCSDSPARVEGITRGAFLLSLGALASGVAVIGIRGRSTPTVQKPIEIPYARDVHHDFQVGLDQRLLSSDSVASEWRLNGLGVVPRELRLFKNGRLPPNYAVQFKCSVDEGAIGWVCRAADWQNHMGFALGRSDSRLQIIRYRTVAGKRTDLGRITLDRYSNLSLFTISTKTDGDLFSLGVGGAEADINARHSIVDSWRDNTFSQGTFGFYAEGTNAPVLLGYQILEKQRT